jgi:multisubunit Na+/H+ antiporter MnhE subunit
MNKNRLMLFVFYFLLWLCFTWSLRIEYLLAGVLCAVAAVVLSGKLSSFAPEKLAEPKRYTGFLTYFIIMAGDLIIASVKTAVLLVRPAPPMTTGTIRVKTTMRTASGAAFLANSLTLVSDAAAVDVNLRNGTLYVHVLTSNGTSNIALFAEKYEKLLRKVFE